MKLPVDTSAIAFLCAVEAEPVVDFETRRPRADENGEPLYVVQLIAMTDGAAEILAVKVPGLPSGLRQGHPVKVSGLVAHAGPRRGCLPGGPHRAGRRPGQGQLTARGGGARATVREGAGAAAKRAAGPLHPPSRVRQHPAFASGVEPMMPTDPTRRSALSVALLAHTGTDYEVDAWMAGDGEANGSVRFDTDRAWFTIQGRPAALRKLAEALVRCAELTEQTDPTPAPVEVAAS